MKVLTENVTLVTEICSPVSCPDTTKDLLSLSDNNLGCTEPGKLGACATVACACCT